MPDTPNIATTLAAAGLTESPNTDLRSVVNATTSGATPTQTQFVVPTSSTPAVADMSRMNQDAQAYWAQQAPGTTVAVAGGNLYRVNDNQAVFTNAAGKQYLMDQRDSFSTIASRIPEFAQEWKTAYGYDPAAMQAKMTADAQQLNTDPISYLNSLGITNYKLLTDPTVGRVLADPTSGQAIQLDRIASGDLARYIRALSPAIEKTYGYETPDTRWLASQIAGENIDYAHQTGNEPLHALDTAFQNVDFEPYRNLPHGDFYAIANQVYGGKNMSMQDIAKIEHETMNVGQYVEDPEHPGKYMIDPKVAATLPKSAFDLVGKAAATTSPTAATTLPTATTSPTATAAPAAATTAPQSAAPAAKTPQEIQAALLAQILATSDPTKWTGEGFGSAQNNAADMAKILSGIGITDISQFGEIPTYQTLETQYQYNGSPATPNADGTFTVQDFVGADYDGNPAYQSRVVPASAVKTVYGTTQDYGEFGSAFAPVDQSKVITKDGKPVLQTGTSYGNKLTGQAVPNTYSERQTGNAWGGTFAGSGNTGYRVFFDDKGNPHFYTTGASSNTLYNMLADNPILNVAANIAAATIGGPLGTAALHAAEGQSLGDVAKAAALSYLGGQVGNYVTDAAGQAINPDVGSALGPDNIDIGGGFNPATGGSALNADALTNLAAKTAGNAVQQYVASGGKTDLGDAVLYGGISTGVNMVASQVPGYKDLPAPVRTFVDKSISSVIKDGNLSDAALQSAAIAAGIDAAKIGMADYRANYPLNSKEVAELTPEERAAYDSGGMRGLQNFTLQNQVLAKADTYKEGEATPPAETDHEAFLRSIGITPDTTGEWASPTNQEILDALYGGNQASDTVDVVGAKDTSNAEPGFENWVDPNTVLITGKKDVPVDEGTMEVTAPRLINAGDENVYNPGETYNAGDENVFAPGTTSSEKTTTNTGSKITVTPPGAKTPTPATSAQPSTPASYKGSTTTTLDPIYAETGSDWSLFKTLEELMAGSRAEKDSKKSKQKTKMASGGYLDNMLAESGSVDDLLKILRN